MNRVVLLAGVQVLDHDAGNHSGTTPRKLLANAVRQLFDQDDSLGLRRDHIDHVAAVRSDTLWYANLGELVARDAHLGSVSTSIGENGGHGPVQLVAQISQLIADGEMQCALIVGAEAGRSVRKCRDDIVKRDSSDPVAVDDDSTFEPVEWTTSQLDWSSDDEFAAGLQRPLEAYALIETACWIRDELDLEQYQQRLDQIAADWASLSEVAARNPYAWSQQVLSAGEITTVTHDSPMVAYPYTRNMCANDRVDMGAAIVLCSEDFALANGIDLIGAWYIDQSVSAQEAPHLTSRPGIYWVRPYRVFEETFADFVAGAEPGEMYTCFPSLRLTVDADWPVVPSLYGGLPFGGGPWNSAMMHPLASLVDGSADLDEHAQAVVVAGNGGYATRHCWIRLTRDPVTPRHTDIGEYSSTHQLVPTDGSPLEIEAFTVSVDDTGRQRTLVVAKDAQREGFRSLLTSYDPAIAARLQDLRDFAHMPVAKGFGTLLQSLEDPS